MNTYVVKVKITVGELVNFQPILLQALDPEYADRFAYLILQRGELEPSDSGFFDMGGEIHLEVIRVDEVADEHVAIMEHYLEGKPLPQQPDGWHVSWEIDLDRHEGETPRDAAMVAGEIAIDQFMKLAGRSPNASVTKPALTINGQLIDFELES